MNHGSFTGSAEPLLEPLTRREKEILKYQAEGLTSSETAERLSLAVSSVRWYVRQIYGKLGVNSKQQALNRARELGLLRPEASNFAPIPGLTTLAPGPGPSLPSGAFTFQAAPRHNLPVQRTSLIGRAHEVQQVQKLLAQTSLVTLTGSGGVGKTRLSLRVAETVLDEFADGVWYVELASLTDPDRVPQQVAVTLGVREVPGQPILDSLTSSLQTRQVLLVLDNCEHILDACAQLVDSLLKASPQLKVLTSSREPLGVGGEVIFRVPSLPFPAPGEALSPEKAMEYAATQLFADRARLARPDFQVTAENIASLARICQRLDGIPLAIELAAARLRLLSVDQIALRLNDAFRLLTGGSRTALPRHQTLQALIDWSYNLLSEGERGLLRSLSAFAGGWTLEAAEGVVGGSPVILDLLGTLADKSLILVAPAADGEMRYHMLETVRQYAHSRLVEAGETADVRQRHLDYYIRLVEMLEPKLRSREQIRTLDILGRELDNLRLALEWALQADVTAGLRLAASLQWFWHIRHHWTEGISWLEQGLAAEARSREGLPPTGSQALIRAKALTSLGLHIFTQYLNGPEKATPIFEESLTLYRASVPTHRQGLAWALKWLGECKIFQGDPAQARVLGQEALILFRGTGDHFGIAESLRLLGSCEIDPSQAKKIYQEMLAINEADGDTDGIAYAHMLIGMSASAEGDYTGACAAYEASQEHFRQVGNADAVANASLFLAFAAQFNGDLERAVLCLEQARFAYIEMANDESIAMCLFTQCLFASGQGRYDRVAELNEEAKRIAQKTGTPEVITHVLYHHARQARLLGHFEEARKYAEEGLNSGRELGYSKTLVLLELGYLALQDGDLARAGALCHEALQVLIYMRNLYGLNMILDGLAVLAVRQGKMERAARLIGTRLCRGWSHALSPIERAEREADFAAITTALGEERLAQLQSEGYALTFMQVLALAQEEN